MFAGTATKNGSFRTETTYIGQTSQTFNYRYLLGLNDVQGLTATVLDSRPAQLQSKTGYNCDEEPMCKVNWLDVKLPKAMIRETRETDGSVDFNENVSEINIPMSSRTAAQTAATTLEQLVAGCRTQERR